MPALPHTTPVIGKPLPAWRASRLEGVADTLAVLARARALLADEQRWCRGSFARGWRNIPVPVKSAVARLYCILGALMRAGRELGLSFEEARNSNEWQIGPVQDWNDDPERTHAEVIAAFDAVLSAVESAA